ncbi:Baseplate J-like protein [uncultured archaeon]|nr:Baseplate J-like protein [uncultured archaeon]
METKTPRLDNRTSKDIYNQALELAKHYCPEWADKDWKPDHFDPDDPGLVLFKLFSKMSEHLVTQLNKIPDKHRIAFLDFMGIDVLAARPAQVPLTFYLAEGAAGAEVPSGAAVASSRDPEVVFETELDLRVVPAKLGAVYSINPADDTYTDHSNASAKTDKFSVFGEGVERSIDHVLYLGDEMLFDIRIPVKALKIRFKGENLSGEYFDQWLNGGISHGQITSTSSNQLEIPLIAIPVIKRSTVDDTDSFWLSVRPADGTKIVDAVKLPEISAITADLTVSDILPEQAFSNDTPVDVKKGFYPFGEVPKAGDTLYIGSEEAFSKKDATITLNIKLKDNSPTNVTLHWEFWDGKQWALLGISDGSGSTFAGNKAANFADSTKAFTDSTNTVVSFTCPLIISTEINGQSNRWIRVKIISGDYGKSSMFGVKSIDDVIKILPAEAALSDQQKNAIKKKMEETKYTWGEYIPSTLKSPFIESIAIQYDYQNKPVQEIKTYNNFHYKSVDIANKFKPYEPPLDKSPALYLGFENDKKIAGASISVYFAVKEKLFSAEPGVTAQNADNLISDNAGLKWEYFFSDTQGWKEFRVEAETDSFTTGGIVLLHIPSDMTNTAEFGKNLCWLRISPKNEQALSLPELKGISPNTVWAVNSSTVKNEILGSGTGKPGLLLSFSKKPVLEGEVIEIKEAGIPPDAEIKALESETGVNPLRLVKDEKTGEIKEIWIRWHETRDFALSGPSGRHYTLDRLNGKILFGDGKRGMLPPRGTNNVVAREYKSGGGSKGNQEPGAVTLLKRKISNIESVTNHVSSSGGKDQENLEKAITRGPHALKNRGSAVTREDFEWLALEASQDVVKAKCIPDAGGKIYVIIVPDRDDEAPLPESGLIDTVERYLKERALVTIRSDRIEVTGPRYEKINVYVTATLKLSAESVNTRDKITEELRTFLHPLKGGQHGEGWDFGDGIFISEVAAVVESIEGIDYITDIRLEKYLFNWEDVPGSDSSKLLAFLKDELGFNLVDTAKITKTDQDTNIHVLIAEKSVDITLDADNGKALLKTGDKRTYKLQIRKENSKLGVYRSEQAASGDAKGVGYVTLGENTLPCAGTINVDTG